MGEFWVVEGIDGAGKSHLLSRLADTTCEAVVLRKDDRPKSGDRWADGRLAVMHILTWGYDHIEPVWNYPSRYWLHTLAAWCELFHHVHVAPTLAEGRSVVVDGWYFKHQARMALSGDEDLVALAARVFSALPQPDQVVRLSTPPDLAATRRSGSSKPSEHGAFVTGQAVMSERDFATYQTCTSQALDELLRRHPARVHTLDPGAPLEGLLSLLREETAP
ncbi:AAA family ATPase [Nocardiopsis sp. EMB25]|uniref:dTMP kinase n=1 Tax=Nocardiopsis sp. EMB25 TaxID=2835867 RepID=UPI002283BD6C|nr:AAA family ATPase [Nocardiopsis sp. EMB25]MCY9783307.1 AAA family ATPase [Nocardiopsis sp. EMB25]